jgi:hypothetical protein
MSSVVVALTTSLAYHAAISGCSAYIGVASSGWPTRLQLALKLVRAALSIVTTAVCQLTVVDTCSVNDLPLPL